MGIPLALTSSILHTYGTCSNGVRLYYCVLKVVPYLEKLATSNPCADEGVRGKSPKVRLGTSKWCLRKSRQKKVECVIRSVLSSFSNMLSNEYKQLDVWKYINANHAFHTKQYTDIYICKI